MIQLLLPIIYLAFISLGLPDSLLGSAWPSMYPLLGVPVSHAGILSMIISFGTIVATVHDAIHIRAVHQLLQNAKLLFGGRRHQILPLLRQDGQICDTPLDVFGIVDVGRCQFHQVPHAPADEITVALKVAVFAAGCAKDFCIGHSDGWLFRHD